MVRWFLYGVGYALVASAMLAMPAAAQDLKTALEHAYQLNPDLNAQRFNTRGVDETVTNAKSGLRPKLSVGGDAGAASTDYRIPGRKTTTETNPSGASVSLSQPLFMGGRVINGIGVAEASVRASRQVLRNTEQNTLLDAVTAYMNVIRERAILDVRDNNIKVLSELVRQTQDRFSVGEVTRTDVALAQARLAGAKADAALARSNMAASQARFTQVIGLVPKKLAPQKPFQAKISPKSQGEAVQKGLENHPAIAAALHGVDAQELQIKVVEGELYPTISAVGTLSRRFDVTTQNDRRNNASLVAQLTVPIFDGGTAAARTRQARETLGEKQMQLDSARERVVAAAVSAWALLEATKYQIEASSAQASAAETALRGMQEEQTVGQRTVLDVLNAQQDLLNARLTQITAQRDRVVASYGLVSAIGALNAQTLGLRIPVYDPTQHYDSVKDRWFGLTPPPDPLLPALPVPTRDDGR